MKFLVLIGVKIFLLGLDKVEVNTPPTGIIGAPKALVYLGASGVISASGIYLLASCLSVCLSVSSVSVTKMLA